MAEKKEQTEAPPTSRIVELDEIEAAALRGAVIEVNLAQAAAERIAKKVVTKYGMPPETEIRPLDRSWTKVQMTIPAKKAAEEPAPPPAAASSEPPADGGEREE